jgi:hypothetical protein
MHVVVPAGDIRPRALTLADAASCPADRPAITLSSRRWASMAHAVHSVQESVSMTRSTKTTIRIGADFEIISLTWSPLTESNRRPSPYHGHATAPTAH